MPIAIEAATPERLEAATELLAILMPPAQRGTIVSTMIEPMLANIAQGMMQAPQFQNAFEDPEAQSLLNQFLARQRARTMEQIQASLPGLFDVMARAYARRFTARQLGQIGQFFETDSGQAYLRESVTIMNDPEVAAWQRDRMTQSMGEMQGDVAAFMAQIAESESGSPEPRGSVNGYLDAMRGTGEPTCGSGDADCETPDPEGPE